jgi:hypothetical protein
VRPGGPRARGVSRFAAACRNPMAHVTAILWQIAESLF